MKTGIKPPRRSQQGLLLVECMVYIALVMLITGIGVSLFTRTLSFQREIERNSNDIVQTLKVGEQWRMDIRKAVRPIMVENHRLKIPQVNSRVTYDWSNGSLWRIEFDDPPQLLLRGVKASEFIKNEREHVAAWRWEIELDRNRGKMNVKPLFTFGAVDPIATKELQP
jgi:hypothetical protein